LKTAKHLKTAVFNIFIKLQGYVIFPVFFFSFHFFFQKPILKGTAAGSRQASKPASKADPILNQPQTPDAPKMNHNQALTFNLAHAFFGDFSRMD
jgi:hypothetical protein